MWHESEEGETALPVPYSSDGTQLGDGLGWIPNLTRQDVARATAYLPENYCADYQYPLICYLHANGCSERDVENWFPAISDSSYLALGVRAPFPHRRGLPGEYRWIGRRPDASQGVLEEAINMLLESHNVNVDRITLMGEGEGALVALQLFLCSQSSRGENTQPVAGVICKDLPGCWPRALPPLRESATGRVLLLDGVSSGESMAAVDGLLEAGLDISLANDQPAERQIDRWLMQSIPTAIW